MDTQSEFLKEYEVRLFDGHGAQILIVPVVAASEAQVLLRAEALLKANDGARYEVRGLMRSARHDGAKGAFHQGGTP